MNIGKSSKPMLSFKQAQVFRDYTEQVLPVVEQLVKGVKTGNAPAFIAQNPNAILNLDTRRAVLERQELPINCNFSHGNPQTNRGGIHVSIYDESQSKVKPVVSRDYPRNYPVTVIFDNALNSIDTYLERQR